MGWWEQLLTMDPPEDRWNALSDFSRSTAQKKIGTNSAHVTHPGSAFKTFSSYSMGWDLSAYPSTAKLCAWLYISDQTAMGGSDYIDFCLDHRMSGYCYKRYVKADLITGWNFLAVPLPGLTNYTLKRIQESMGINLVLYRASSGNIDFYFDDVYVSTDEEKNLDTNPTYIIKHFERYSTTTSENQEYAGILEPTQFNFRRSLNQIGEANFTFHIDDYDDLPDLMDTVRIYRNGKCEWDGVVVNKKKNYGLKTCTLICKTSEYVLQKIMDLSSSYFIADAAYDVGAYLAEYVHAADDVTGSGNWQQQGFGIDDVHPMGYSSTGLSATYIIPSDEFVNPWEMIIQEQNKVGFDFEMRPPFVFNYWEPEKGRSIFETKLVQGTHFTVKELSESGLNLYTACRAKSRGAGSALSGDDSDTTAMNDYARLVLPLQTTGKLQAEVNAAADEAVDQYKDPTIAFDVELLAGGWIDPWDLGDIKTCVIEGTEYTKRIYAIDVSIVQETESVGLILQ